MKYFFVLLFPLFLNGQTQSQSNYIETNGGGTYFRPSVITTIKKDYSDVPFVGSPYHVDSYQKGDIIVNGNIERSAIFRYNAYNDEVEISVNDKKQVLLKRDYIEMVSKNFRYKILEYDGKKGYYAVLNKKGLVSLVLKPKKKYVKGKEPKSGYEEYVPPRFMDESLYYILKSDILIKIKLKKKDILKTLGDKKNEIEKFASSKKLSFKKEKDIVKIIDHYNSL